MIIALSGYYDPIHVGHIREMEMANKLGKVVVIVNNRNQALQKKGFEFMPFKERLKMVQSIRYVHKSIPSIDKDLHVCKTLEKLKPDIYFKGGDRNKKNVTKEQELCKRLKIRMIFKGKKIQSSLPPWFRLGETGQVLFAKPGRC